MKKPVISGLNPEILQAWIIDGLYFEDNFLINQQLIFKLTR